MNYHSAADRFVEQKTRAGAGQLTRHCVSGSLRRLYAWAGVDVPEEVLLGLGEGVGFIYWHAKDSVPMLGGRAQPAEGMETLAARRTGVRLDSGTTSSLAKARTGLVAALQAGQAVMLQVDMGYLPYFSFAGSGYHFGGHVVLACGYDSSRDLVLVADREAGFFEVPMDQLAQARASRHKPFPPANRWWTADATAFHQPAPVDLALALEHQARAMLNPPIANLGCRGLATAARRVRDWPGIMGSRAVKAALWNLWVFASPVGGSGGGNFRHMLADYSGLCASACQNEALARATEGFRDSAREWDQAAELARSAVAASGGPADVAAGDLGTDPGPDGHLPPALEAACREIGGVLERITALETAAWRLCLPAG